MRTLPLVEEETLFFTAEFPGVYSFVVRSVSSGTASIKRNAESPPIANTSHENSFVTYLDADDELSYNGEGFSVWCNRQADEFPPEE